MTRYLKAWQKAPTSPHTHCHVPAPDGTSLCPHPAPSYSPLLGPSGRVEGSAAAPGRPRPGPALAAAAAGGSCRGGLPGGGGEAAGSVTSTRPAPPSRSAAPGRPAAAPSPAPRVAGRWAGRAGPARRCPRPARPAAPRSCERETEGRCSCI